MSLTIVNNNGCTNSVTMPAYVIVHPNPVADFSMSPQPTTVQNGTIHFTDLSQGPPNQWSWGFGDLMNSFSSQQNPQFTYTDTGTFVVQLIVITPFGCRDTIEKSLRIGPDYLFFIPNAFTPNGDGKNDFFMPVGTAIDKNSFKMWIFDRWGNEIWQTDSWGKGWDGRANGGSEIAQEDVYVWKIVLNDTFGTKHSYVGHVSLIK